MMLSTKDVEKLAQAFEGVPVFGTLPGMGADRAGVMYGDVILAVNGVRTHTLDDYCAAVKDLADEMLLTVVRAGETFELRVSRNGRTEEESTPIY